ncbi:MAG: tetraacyldisaccharide 4'-kinase [Phycisphaerales bacterium]|nr:MAG: tetraacyldisaccharide 4'-kinase [Phycisphaerales bacterium]
MDERSPYRRIMAGQTGVWAAPLRAVLRAGAIIYGGVVYLRNRRFDRRGPTAILPVPVISVGNITAGGTGKTPLVIELVNHLEQMGYSPAVVSRGYAAFDEQINDEECVIRAECPGVVCVSDPDRVQAGEIAHSKYGADVIVLDDGFQHRRLSRTLDIVVVDASCPFGYGYLLPRGLLREPVANLARGDVAVVTRSDQVSSAAMSALDKKLRRIAPDAVHLHCRHSVTGVCRLDGTPIDGALEGKRAVLFAGIGRPEAFATTVRSLDVEVVGERWWPDHYHYRVRDIDSLLGAGTFPAHDVLLTTQKDAAKISMLGRFEHANILVVNIAIDFLGDGGTILRSVLADALPRS